jgi:hypothetical protein
MIETADGILSRVMEALARELGPSGMIRFLQQLKPGSGDYTAERHKILDRIDLSEIPALLAELRRDGRLSGAEDDQRV